MYGSRAPTPLRYALNLYVITVTMEGSKLEEKRMQSYLEDPGI
jgi:hypothetical protein